MRSEKPKKLDQVHAVFTQQNQNETNPLTIFVALSSSKGEGNYLVAATYIKGQIVIAHECPAIQLKRSCWHTEVVLYIFQTIFSHQPEIASARTVFMSKKITMKRDWVQIPHSYIQGVNQNEHRKLLA
ncbi:MULTISPECIES: hypothetical protein [Paenibacillus]|uniref:Uncharacterized protein n=1 Tax=Paenibacillus vandeheii TaxID=3035917 RepID=A0ABT8JFH3_9BACL|nr:MULTISPECIES: hypothetical protein [Paenibacillus]KGP81971.1 hypothetical protein P364_0114215 [Paenibacillus sp. MAEPY2]KGP86057.1 hypothetical protein P363_0119690 [Paenibacillus sp. MAEPY1]MDN4603888.1 hypothetical protein [Paenibacillus vandeheii]